MKHQFKGWDAVAKNLCSLAKNSQLELNDGQKGSLLALAKRLPNNGVIIADEVGMGKTRIAVATAHAVTQAGGRVAILVPPTLGHQWNDELRIAELEAPSVLCNFNQYLQAWSNSEFILKDTNTPWFDESIPSPK
ncbi:MAG: hypothetical protein Q9M11_06195 [Mariprofundaceae bacterium]|nr:hypothetical protein [Mariprofundaceae bacterium]